MDDGEVRENEMDLMDPILKDNDMSPATDGKRRPGKGRGQEQVFDPGIYDDDVGDFVWDSGGELETATGTKKRKHKKAKDKERQDVARRVEEALAKRLTGYWRPTDRVTRRGDKI